MATPPGIDLLDRRARLLATRDAGGRPMKSGELDDVTDALARLLDGESAAVRCLTLADDPELARALADAEPVNPVAGESDLQDRFDIDRRVFVIEHPALPGRPMNVVWVALERGLPDTLGDVLDPSGPTCDPRAADTAVFYSIWNAERGLKGLGRGPELLSGAMSALSSELPGVQTYVTLSPIPGLRRWLEKTSGAPVADAPTDIATLAARYLCSLEDSGRPRDPVARFHLGNGARLLRVCPDADSSDRGIQRSFAVMANYRYAPEDRDANRASLAEGRPVLGDQVLGLLRSD